MCRCCQRLWEDFYWTCIEEKFCYDETIANYNPDEDEYLTNKNGNGFLSTLKLDNNNSPVCNQPRSIDGNIQLHNNSSKIHEDDYREIQTNGPFLGPEILAVFANSQIFHEHQSNMMKKTTPNGLGGFPSVHGRPATTTTTTTAATAKDLNAEKLLIRLEGTSPYNSKRQSFSTNDESSTKPSTIKLTDSSSTTLTTTSTDHHQDEVILRPHFDHLNNASVRSPPLDKRLRNIQNPPYFSFRPASENDIFAISGTTTTGAGTMISQISMTPEIPSISYSTLPKHYDDTPSIEKYKETISLQSIQTANSARVAEFDYTMPRYYRKSDIILMQQSADSISVASSSTPSATIVGSPRQSPKYMLHHSPRMSPKRIEISKRLKLIRNTLPPLSIHLSKEYPRDKSIN